MSSQTANDSPTLPLKPQMKITSVVELPAPRPSLKQRGLAFLIQHPRLTVALTGLSFATLSLAVWLGALFLENKLLKAQLAQRSAAAEGAPASDELKTRLAEAQQQMSQLQNQIEQEQTAEMLDSRDALIAENARLVQELSQIAKPQLGAPLVKLTSASQKQAEAVPKTEQFTVVDVPPQLALFTVVLPAPTVAASQSYANYFVELADGKGKNVSWSEQIKNNGAPELALTFAKRSHAPGKYQLKLYGLNGKKREFLDRYDWQLNHLPEPAAKKPGKKK